MSAAVSFRRRSNSSPPREAPRLVGHAFDAPPGRGRSSTVSSACVETRARHPEARVTLLTKIEHFVVLMLENRSYDHVLGGLADPKYAGVSADVELPYTGPRGPATVRVTRGTPPDRFGPDPKHGHHDVLSQIYGAP